MLQDAVDSGKTPGLQYVRVNAEQTLFSYQGGHADLAGQVPMSAATTMMAYSMSKTITAAAVLRLVDGGLVGLDDAVGPYPGVTVRHLLSHTSGAPNPIPLRWVHPVERHATFDEHAALLAVLQANPRLSSPPGSRYRYSNIGYWLLGRVVEKASGRSFTDYVAQEVLQPLGIGSEEMGYAIPDPARHAHGYLEKYSFINLAKGLLIDREFIGEYEGNWLQIRPHYLNGPAFGGLVGTANGFAKFLQDQLRPHSVLFGDSTRTLLYQSGTFPMTLGWHVGELDRSTFFYKEGGGGGFHCMMRIYRDRGIGTILMTNATGLNVGRMLDTSDRLVLSH